MGIFSEQGVKLHRGLNQLSWSPYPRFAPSFPPPSVPCDVCGVNEWSGFCLPERPQDRLLLVLSPSALQCRSVSSLHPPQPPTPLLLPKAYAGTLAFANSCFLVS